MRVWETLQLRLQLPSSALVLVEAAGIESVATSTEPYTFQLLTTSWDGVRLECSEVGAALPGLQIWKLRERRDDLRQGLGRLRPRACWPRPSG